MRSRPDPEHGKQLTREAITPSVHYIHFELTPAQVAQFEAGPVTVKVAHPNYTFASELADSSRSALLSDLRE